MAATLGDSPTARALRGNFSSQPSLPHLAKHFFLSFLFLLRAKKPNTNKILSGSTPPSRHNADFCFHRAKISDKRPVFHTKIRIPVRINFPWQQHLAPWSTWHDIMLIDCAKKKRVQRYQEHHRVVFEVFELSSAKEGRVSLLVDVFPSAA